MLFAFFFWFANVPFLGSNPSSTDRLTGFYFLAGIPILIGVSVLLTKLLRHNKRFLPGYALIAIGLALDLGATIIFLFS